MSATPTHYFYDTSGTADQRQFYWWNTGGKLIGRWVNDANNAVVSEGLTIQNNGNVGHQ